MTTEQTKSTAFSPEHTRETTLGRAVEGLAEAHPGQSGFLPVSDGVDALAIRLLLAERAETCIDTQYYEIEDDLAGHLFFEALLRAAERGVRIRLLLDDYRTKGHDTSMAALRAHPNFEMRIYNPFARRNVRFVDGLLSFARVNRRMHNKSFTVDNQMTVIGGRNIGDHYFSVGDEHNFADLDVLAIGPVVNDVSSMFDDYWNSRAAVPVSQVAISTSTSDVAVDKVLDRVSQAKAETASLVYAAAIERAKLERLQKDMSLFTWAPYQLVYDLPAKTQIETSAEGAKVRRLLVSAFDAARKEVVLISPYFVPRLTGIRRFKELRGRGVEVTVVTNSLASNNQVYAHGGYAPVRKALLRMGVRLFELRADAHVVHKRHERDRRTKATLHTKAFAIDRKKLFVGSFNFDPRSANINTEMGVFIDSPALAESFADGAETHVPKQCYELQLENNRALRWHADRGGTSEVLSKEPQTGFMRRVAGTIARLLPIRGQV